MPYARVCTDVWIQYIDVCESVHWTADGRRHSMMNQSCRIASVKGGGGAFDSLVQLIMMMMNARGPYIAHLCFGDCVREHSAGHNQPRGPPVVWREVRRLPTRARAQREARRTEPVVPIRVSSRSERDEMLNWSSISQPKTCRRRGGRNCCCIFFSHPLLLLAA